MQRIKQLLDNYLTGKSDERATLYTIARYDHNDADLRAIVNEWLDDESLPIRRTILRIIDWLAANDDSLQAKIARIVGR